MVESDAEVLVKEERRPKVIPVAVPPSNLPLMGPIASLLGVFDFRLCPS
jgi:hypothetical protein